MWGLRGSPSPLPVHKVQREWEQISFSISVPQAECWARTERGWCRLLSDADERATSKRSPSFLCLWFPDIFNFHHMSIGQSSALP